MRTEKLLEKYLPLIKQAYKDCKELSDKNLIKESDKKYLLWEKLIRQLSEKLHKRRYTFAQIHKLLDFQFSVATLINWTTYGAKKSPSSTKSKVKKRDKNKCKICKTKNYPLHVHHIHSSKNHSIKNLMTLCQPCHIKLHKVKRSDISEYGEMVKHYE